MPQRACCSSSCGSVALTYLSDYVVADHDWLCKNKINPNLSRLLLREITDTDVVLILLKPQWLKENPLINEILNKVISSLEGKEQKPKKGIK